MSSIPISYVFATSAVEVLTVVGALLGAGGAIVVPFILYLLAKRGREWDEMKTTTEKHAQSLASHEPQIQSLRERLDQTAKQQQITDRRLNKDFVTTHQYQRDIDALEKYIQLLRESIHHQTDLIEKLRE